MYDVHSNDRNGGRYHRSVVPTDRGPLHGRVVPFRWASGAVRSPPPPPPHGSTQSLTHANHSHVHSIDITSALIRRSPLRRRPRRLRRRRLRRTAALGGGSATAAPARLRRNRQRRRRRNRQRRQNRWRLRRVLLLRRKSAAGMTLRRRLRPCGVGGCSRCSGARRCGS